MKFFILQSMLVVSQMTLATSYGPPTAPGEDENTYKMEWIGEPEIRKEEGRTVTISSYVDSGDRESEVTVTKDISLAYEWRKGHDVEAKVGGLLSTKFGVSMSTRHGNSTKLSHKIPIDKHSLGIAKFRENLIIIKGRVRITYLYEWTDCASSVFVLVFVKNHCYRKPEEHEIELVQTEVDELGNAVGRYWVDYIGTDKYKHPKFYNLVNKTTDFSGALPIEDKVKSAYECGQRAIELEQYLALYIVSEMKCLVKRVEQNNVLTLDRYGYEIGQFSVRGTINKEVTSSKATRQRWIDTNECDLIRDDSEDSHLCLTFPTKHGSVLMVRRASDKHLAAALAHTEKSSPGSSSPPTRRPSKTVMQVSHPHPKFYHLTKKEYTISSGAIKAHHILSAFECGDLTIKNERFMAIYNPRDQICYMETVDWSHGRSYDSQGKLLGPYNIRLKETDHSTSSMEREHWISESKCDVIHNTVEGSHTCETFESSDQGFIVMLRYNDAYETYKMYKEFQEKENERLIFSESKHWKYYSIKDKSYNLGKAVEQVKQIESAYDCGELGMSKSKYIVLFSYRTNTCSLFNVTTGVGRSIDRWGKPVGSYDVPGYDKEHTSSAKVLESWTNPYKCDLVFTNDDRVYYCKDFPYEANSVLMMRKDAH